MPIVGTRWFEPGDGSESERLHHIYNRSKHTGDAIKGGRLPNNGRLAVWMVNEGLQSVDHLLTWQELTEIVDQLGACADHLQDPVAASANTSDE